MKTDQSKPVLDGKGEGRRTLLKSLSFGGLIAAAATLTGRKAEAAAPPVDGTEGGYRETEHISTYYDTTRF